MLRLASGAGIGRAGKESGFADSLAVFHAATNEASDPLWEKAKKIIDSALSASAHAAWIISHSFLPQRIILGGGIMEDYFDLFATAMRNRLDQAVMIPHAQVEIEKVTLGSLAGVVGAASLVLRADEFRLK